ncbi:DUF1203 domain-containing protein [Arenibaculum pallidiluteum]|uniref:DUF1203 domain-containing protein n=1 Tax=Arenibaculum pallidiluteum TaxID=2812559 RepID=UPI001A964F14|nr:DUF1203 domain-containing protein [Arenibaculum pallidiluteum]
MDFRIRGLQAGPFLPLFALDEVRLAEMGAQRVTAEDSRGYPCRISLRDAAPGETLILLPYQHQPAASPYRASGPIFVREAARETYDRVNAVPEQMRRRLVSLRAYDGRDWIIDADVVEGARVETLIARLLADPRTAYMHAHWARYGCYACRIDRAA